MSAQPSPSAYVKGPRKDGKFAVRLVYPISGKTLNKIMTHEAVQEIITYRWFKVYGVDALRFNFPPKEPAHA